MSALKLAGISFEVGTVVVAALVVWFVATDQTFAAIIAAAFTFGYVSTAARISIRDWMRL